MALMVCFLFLSMIPVEDTVSLEESTEIHYSTNSNDGYSAIEYTDEHTTASLVSEGRTATLTMPGGHDYERALPLVIALHGYSSSGSFNAWWMSLYDSVHENEHLLLTPDGTLNWIAMRYWNATDACCNLFDSSVDDVAFLEGLIGEAVTNYGADPEGVVLIGHSNGGFMAHRMACERGNLIETIISLNGATWNDFNNDCPDTGRPNILHVHSTLDGIIQYDGGSGPTGEQYPSAPQSTSFWATRSGCDSTWTNLGAIDLTSSDGVAETDNLEHLNCADGNRVSHWRINNGNHAPSLNDPGWANQTIGWALSDFVRDSDGDGYRDDVDAFIYNPYEWADADGDLVGDNTDQCDQDPSGWDDSDGDGVCIPADLFPDDPNEWSDADGDGIGDRGDPDDDNDGFDDDVDAFPLDSSEWYDTDEDGIGNNADFDDDGDFVEDSEDVFPLDANEWADFDEDGVGDNADLDDDNDGWSDVDEVDCQTNPNDDSHIPLDSDADGICDLVDSDDDDDGVDDYQDVFPLNPEEWSDSDEDGVGDNSDVFPTDDSEWLDSDEDGVGDNSDAFPNDPTEWVDTDGDGVGDNTDEFPEDGSEWIDSDGDGVGDNADAFPNDQTETTDTDGDGVGDSSDVFPTHPYEWMDSDGDNFGDNSDAFPGDPEEWLDTDGDGYGDNRDWAPFDAEVWDEPPDYTFMIIGTIAVIFVGVLVYTSRRQA